ncbi:MAG: hypothetical protein IT529_02195 [Burkholderiales bacterium]|nr:hypothetical protein [Burkholderiales bacterium]
MAKKPHSRECRPCTACCDGWLQIRVNGMPAYPGHPCPHSTGAGCDDYEHRPVDPCVQFICGWRMEQSPLPDWMKPNEAKVIVLLDQHRWRGLPVDVAVPVGRRIPPRALNWLRQFAERENRMLLYSEQIVENGAYTRQQSVSAFGPPEFQRDMAELASRGESLPPAPPAPSPIRLYPGRA